MKATALASPEVSSPLSLPVARVGRPLPLPQEETKSGSDSERPESVQLPRLSFQVSLRLRRSQSGMPSRRRDLPLAIVFTAAVRERPLLASLPSELLT